MGLFTVEDREKIDSAVRKSQKRATKPKTSKKSVESINAEIMESSAAVMDYFKGSDAILIKDSDQLAEYIDDVISAGIAGIDTETTGLDRTKDYVVGMSLYYPDGTKCYIPFKHRVPIFEDLYSGQFEYEVVREQLQRLVDSDVKLVFANANFDLYMIWKDLDIDLCPIFYYDVILAWRCIKEDETQNGLKALYAKYPLRGEGDPKRFSDFFSPELFPYSKPEVAKLYAANDAEITYNLYLWQLPLVTKGSEECKKHKLEHIADLIWNVEFPLVSVIQYIERNGMYIDVDTAKALQSKYHAMYDSEISELQGMVEELLRDSAEFKVTKSRAPFTSSKDFNPRSTKHVQYLLYDLLKLPNIDGKKGTGKDVMHQFSHPIPKKIMTIRSLSTNINSFIDKLPDSVSEDGKIHADFKQCGAATGRMCIAEGAPVQTLPGPKPIESVKVGDVVYCFDDMGYVKTAPVLNLWHTGSDRECVDIKWQGIKRSGILTCTPEHKVRNVYGEWVQAADLRPWDKVSVLGDVLESPFPMDFGTVVSVSPSKTPCEVYDIEVEGYHNFVAAGVCVHNSSSDPNLQNIPSRLSDIRHMFRADPMQVENVEVKGDSPLALKSWDSLRSPDGEWVKACDLSEGDKVEVSAKGDVASATVSGIVFEPPDVYLSFDGIEARDE